MHRLLNGQNARARLNLLINARNLGELVHQTQLIRGKPITLHSENIGPQYPPQMMQQQTQHLHPVDQAILDIANEYQFLPSEVRESYDKTGDMVATKARFAKMRMLINSMA